MFSRAGFLFIAAFMLSLGGHFADAAQLIYSNDVLGDVEPCGCRSNPLGGMARRENWLASLTDPSRLVVDAGNLLFESKAIPLLMQKNALEKAKVLIDAMNATRLDYAVAGSKDFALGYETFKVLRSRARFRYLGANVIDKKNGKNPFDAYAVVSLKTKTGSDVRVAVVGLVGEDAEYPPELKVTSIDAAIQKAVSEIESREKKIDLWVALTHQGYDADVALAKKTNRFRVIIGSGTESFLQNPERVEKSILFQTSFRNQYMGLIDLDALLTQSDEFHRLVGLDAAFNSKPRKQNVADRLVVAYKKTKRAPEPSKSMNEINAHPSPSKFATFPGCASCHFDVFRFWLATRHARALDALAKRENLTNPECVVCHSVGYGAEEGFSDLGAVALLENQKVSMNELKDRFHSDFLTPGANIDPKKDARLQNTLKKYSQAFAPVQCENCHGPGIEHSTSPKLKLAAISESTCVRCHTHERAPDWYDSNRRIKTELFRSNLARIRCPAIQKHKESH